MDRKDVSGKNSPPKRAAARLAKYWSEIECNKDAHVPAPAVGIPECWEI